jgi:DNA-binding winged helix-turn-helix (wHTH) protein
MDEAVASANGAWQRPEDVCSLPRSLSLPAPARLRVTVLDTVTVVPSGSVLPRRVGSLQQKLLLTLLVAYRNRTVSVDRIAEELWGEHPPRRWLASIRTLANSLRRLAGDRDFIDWTGRGYRLHKDPGRVDTDVDEMLRAIDEASDAVAAERFDVGELAARRALAIYGSGPWTTDCWHWADLAAEAYHLLGRALLGKQRYLTCLVELGRAPEELEWHDGVRSCLAHARAHVSTAPAMV